MDESRYKKEGGAFKLYWNEIQVGEYTGPGAPKQFKEFLNDTINWTQKIRRVYQLVRLWRYNTQQK